MLQVSSFDDSHAASLRAELSRLENPSEGLMAVAMFMADGWFALFSWPDWPKAEANRVGACIEKFQLAHPELVRVEPGSRQWVSLLRTREADFESAEAIANAFDRHFSSRVKWVESAKDSRGRIAAECAVEGAGRFSFELSWKYSTIQPLGDLNDDDLRAFKQAGSEVMKWAAGRIQPILDTLKCKLRELYGERFRGLYVFGSYAKPGDVGIRLSEDSDLDIAVLLSHMESSYKEIQATSGIAYDLSLEHGLVISLAHLREADFHERQTNFTRVISEYAIPVE